MTVDVLAFEGLETPAEILDGVLLLGEALFELLDADVRLPLRGQMRRFAEVSLIDLKRPRQVAAGRNRPALFPPRDRRQAQAHQLGGCGLRESDRPSFGGEELVQGHLGLVSHGDALQRLLIFRSIPDLSD